MQSICFIINSQKKKVDHLVARLDAAFSNHYQVMFLHTAESRHAEGLAVTAVNLGCRYIVAVGGDGTVNEVVNGLMQLPPEKRGQVAVAILPWGTGNDFARSVGSTPSIVHLLKQFEDGLISKVDVGAVRYTQGGRSVLRYFVNIGDIGIGPSTVMMVERLKRILGPTLAFWIGAFCAIFFRKPQPVSIKADGYRYEGKVKAVCMANGRYFGSGLGIAPKALVNDGLLNLVIVGDVSVFTFLRFTGKLRCAQTIIHPEVHYTNTTRCRILSPSLDCPLELDGEVLGSAPLEVEVVSGAVQFLVDPTSCNALRVEPARKVEAMAEVEECCC